MYFAALRPAEAVALRRQDCYMPEYGWGRLTLEKSRPEVNRRWADSATAHEERGLKHRPATETRAVPIPPELVAILRRIRLEEAHLHKIFGAGYDAYASRTARLVPRIF